MADANPSPEALDLALFLNAAPTPYHAVAEVGQRLKRAGFQQFDEREPWHVTEGTQGFVVRAGGSIVAFRTGTRPPAQAGFVLIGAHTDSPNLRLKPLPDLVSNGYLELGVEVYGGVLFSTWLDRDLGVAGRIVLGGGRTEIVRLERAVCRIPNLAIHLNRDVNTQGLLLNPQNHLLPVLGLESGGDTDSGIAALLAECLRGSGAAGASVADVVAFDLSLYDLQPAAFGGNRGEFLFSSRLDNLASCHAALTALIGSADDTDATRIVALYDHEEVGSQSAAGARSTFLGSVLERISTGFGESAQAHTQALARSLLVSADMAHAVHPNYADKHDKQHRPLLGSGPVIKTNVNQSYATDGPAAGAFVDVCRKLDVVPQHFASRNDQPCGSTIGPITAARLGLRSVDVGSSMLSMHSCREMAGTADVATMIRVLTALFSNYAPLDLAR